MFTELSDSFAKNDDAGFKRGISAGLSEILFFMVPFAMYLIVFSMPLTSIVAAGKFTSDQLMMTAGYLFGLACALPLYSVCMYLQKVFSAMRRMVLYAIASVVGTAWQVVLLLFLMPRGLSEFQALVYVSLTSALFFLAVDIVIVAFLRHAIGPLGLRGIIGSLVKSILIGLVGAIVGAAILAALNAYVGDCTGHTLMSILYCVAGGLPAVLVTYGMSIVFKMPESRFIKSVLGRLTRRRG
jgi:putative peptidoglycan lipid II flippase